MRKPTADSSRCIRPAANRSGHRLVRAAVGFGALFVAAAQVPALPGFLGVSTVRGQVYDNEPLLFTPPQEGDHFAFSLATGDFNGDGAEDLATGIPDDDGVTGFEVTNAGAFVVRYGVPGAGLASTSTLFSQFSAGSPDPQEVNEQFGYALAAGDFNGDQLDDLAVSAPGHHEGFSGTGAVAIHYGTASGLETDASEWVVPNYTANILPAAGHYLSFCGQALAAGDFDHNGYTDLAIGCPREYIFSPAPADGVGGVIVLLGGSGGLLPFVGYILNQDSPGILGGAEAQDSFGSAVAAGDFDGDSFDDLAIGVPGEDGGEDGKGIVQIIFGAAGGLDLPNNVLYFQHDSGGVDEAGDQFGAVLTAGDFDGDGYDDLAVGAPFEDETAGFPDAPDTGAISVMFGSASGINLARSECLQQSDIYGVNVLDQSGDRFGFALAAGDLDGDGRADLAVGHPGESSGGPDRGAVTLLMGGPGGVLTRFGDLFAGTGGFPGEVQNSQDYGASTATGDFDGDGFADLVIGSPYFNSLELPNVGAEVVLFGSLFSSGFASGAIETWSDSVP